MPYFSASSDVQLLRMMKRDPGRVVELIRGGQAVHKDHLAELRRLRGRVAGLQQQRAKIKDLRGQVAWLRGIVERLAGGQARGGRGRGVREIPGAAGS